MSVSLHYRQAKTCLWAVAGRSASQSRKLVYLPTIPKGYSASLTDYDKLNTHYLNKALGRLKEELESQSTALRVLNKVPEDKQSLLLGMDD